MAKEVKIILMQKDNSGNCLKLVNDRVISECLDSFGGCSATPAKGYWKDPKSKQVFEDDTLEVTIAITSTHRKVDDILEQIALRYKAAANQLGVYVRNSKQQVIIF